MRLAIIGSRDFDNYSLLHRIVNNLSFEIDEIVSGGAKGEDSLGEKYAKENNIKTNIFYPDWDTYGKKAGFIRNKDIIDNSDFVLAFWDKRSPGTKDSLLYAKKMNKPIRIVNPRSDGHGHIF